MTSLHIIHQLLERASSKGKTVEELIQLVRSVLFPTFWGKVSILDHIISYKGKMNIFDVEELGRGLECKLEGEFILYTGPEIFPSFEVIEPYLDAKIGIVIIEGALGMLADSSYSPDILKTIGNPFVYDHGSAQYKLSHRPKAPVPQTALLEFLTEIHADYPRITNQ